MTTLQQVIMHPSSGPLIITYSCFSGGRHLAAGCWSVPGAGGMYHVNQQSGVSGTEGSSGSVRGSPRTSSGRNQVNTTYPQHIRHNALVSVRHDFKLILLVQRQTFYISSGQKLHVFCIHIYLITFCSMALWLSNLWIYGNMESYVEQKSVDYKYVVSDELLVCTNKKYIIQEKCM